MAVSVNKTAGVGSQSTGNKQDYWDGGAPSEGDLLIVVMTERSSDETPDASLTQSGWTLVDYERVQHSDSTHRKGMAVLYKVAGSSPWSYVEGSWDPTASEAYSVLTAVALSDPPDFDTVHLEFNDNGTTLDETVIDTGTVVTTGPSLIIPIMAIKSQANTPTPSDFDVSFDSGCTTAHTWASSVDYLFAVGIGFAEKASGGSYTVECTQTATDTDNRSIHSALLVFEDTSGAAARSKTMVLR